MIFRLLCFIFCLGISLSVFAQSTFPNNGPADPRPNNVMLRRATVVVAPGNVQTGTDILVEKGRIKAVGKNIALPQGCQEIDCSDKWIYSSFIDLYSNYGVTSWQPIKSEQGRGQKLLSEKPGAYYWNESIHPETNAFEYFVSDEKEANNLRGQGFGVTLSQIKDGISRGSAVLVSTGEKTPSSNLIIDERVAQGLSFSKGSTNQSYPSSQMGSIALLRQLYYDGIAQDKATDEKNLSIEAWRTNANLKSIIAVNSWQEILRATKIAKEFNKAYIIKSGGDEYQRIDAIKATNTPLIIPINFPEVVKSDDILDLDKISLEQIKHVALAPRNPGILSQNGIKFAITSDGLKEIKEFREKLLLAVDHGLDKDKALAALTTVPAELIGESAQIGTIETGKWANFFVMDKNYFDKKAKMTSHFVQGRKYELYNLPDSTRDGKFLFSTSIDNDKYNVHITKSNKEINLVYQDTLKYKGIISVNNNKINFSLDPKGSLDGKYWSCSGRLDGKNYYGIGQNQEGSSFTWTLTLVEEIRDKKKEEKADSLILMPETKVLYPFVGYGNEKMPVAEKVLFKNATLWTNEADGILKETDILIDNCKIVRYGKNLSEAGAKVIDATGKHVTSGVIDEHSHIAISNGVNEGGQESSAEVRIADVINSEDVNIYRQLSGGVTASQLLHGSANPIGGQAAMIKLRWGAAPQDLLIKDADQFIKFALGENVKQVNWGIQGRNRYPQSRMGVEQVYEDYFSRGQAYIADRKANPNMRKDLDLEAIAEILQAKRFITCHSYQQGEINMLMKVADKYKFRVNTFTHILEGYKVADKMKAHGVGASTFSDWWAYKYEVIDAIPYNGAIMHSVGLVVAFNSDDAEMARRLNQEAGKAVLYGGVPEEEAWKFVTLNPAKLLHLDSHMGSLKAGKDADIVLWSDNPLSIYAVAEQTYVDGIKYFDRAEDKIKQATIAQEKMRLLRAMDKMSAGGMKSEGVRPKREVLYHCDSEEE